MGENFKQYNIYIFILACAQSAEITAVAQIKERLTILLTLAAFSISFLCCRELSAIPAVYVGVNSVRANILLTVVYYAGDLVIKYTV